MKWLGPVAIAIGLAFACSAGAVDRGIFVLVEIEKLLVRRGLLYRRTV